MDVGKVSDSGPPKNTQAQEGEQVGGVRDEGRKSTYLGLTLRAVTQAAQGRGADESEGTGMVVAWGGGEGGREGEEEGRQEDRLESQNGWME